MFISSSVSLGCFAWSVYEQRGEASAEVPGLCPWCVNALHQLHPAQGGAEPEKGKAMGNSTQQRDQSQEFRSQLSHFLTTWPRANDLMSLDLQNGITDAYSEHLWETNKICLTHGHIWELIM